MLSTVIFMHAYVKGYWAAIAHNRSSLNNDIDKSIDDKICNARKNEFLMHYLVCVFSV